jgi:hypothetical protein
MKDFLFLDYRLEKKQDAKASSGNNPQDEVDMEHELLKNFAGVSH